MEHDSETKYLEYYAKALLETLFPERYTDLRKDETPDLRMGDNYGIEVTWATFKNQGQAKGIFNHIKGKTLEQIDPRHIRTMNRIETEVLTETDGTIYGYMPMDGENKAYFTEIIHAYRKKKEKRYKTAHIDLFVYPPLAQLDGWLGKDLIEVCFEALCDDPTNPFDHMIIYEEPTLYLYDTKQRDMFFRRATEGQIAQCQEEADQYSGWSKRTSRKVGAD